MAKWSFPEQCLSLLKAAKSDNSVIQSLVDVKNRGGLWKLNDNMLSLFSFIVKKNLKSLLVISNTLLIANYYYARFWKSVVLLMISNIFVS